MPSIFNMFLSEANKKIDSTKDGEENKDPDLGDAEDKDTEKDSSNEDDLFADVDHETQFNGKDDNSDLDPPPPTDDGDPENTDDNTDPENTDNTDPENIDDGDPENTDDNTDPENTDDTENTDEYDDSEPVDDSADIKNKKLLQDFLQIYSDINDMKSMLDNVVGQTKLEYDAISNSIDNLDELAHSINNYIMLRFNTKTYEENLSMYYKIVNSVKITDEIMSKIIENRNKG